ncbi:hypothetical protein HNY73_004586 [Argiope bruennichi]|uniref:Uncharacterized protein n=1 Tax=Argiope bruennichi TaxID=94029 RepID=A0A8T0FPE6_ARGBR|nr:hypothetical protein HNY73_004586 [Argiope bruennichi]
MATRYTAEQFAEALTIWSIDKDFNQCVVSEIEDINEIKPLDLLLSTVNIFLDGFCEKLETECDDYKQGILYSKQTFIDYLTHNCLLLAESNGCFDLILTCAFVSLEVYNITFYFQCFHLSRVAFKLLAKVLEDRFGNMFNTDSGWQELMAYCTKVHAAVLPSKENRPSDYETEDESLSYFQDLNVKYKTFCKETTSNGIIREGSLIQQKRLHCSDPDAKQLFGQHFSNDSSDNVNSTDDESSDDNNLMGGQINHGTVKGDNSSQNDLNHQQQGLESNSAEHNSKSIEIDALNEMIKRTIIQSPDTVDASDDERSDEVPGQRISVTTQGQTKLESLKDHQNCLKNVEKRKELLEFKNEEHAAKFTERDMFNEMTEETSSDSSAVTDESSSDSSVIVESSDDESLADDSIYWEYETMKKCVLRKRITDSKEHLKDVLDRLAMIKRKVDPEIIPSNEYDIPISDNEDIEKLEKCVTKPNFSKWKIDLLEEDVESIKKEICDQKNEKLDNLSQKRVRPEDITDGEIFQNVIDIFDPSDDEDQCEICDGKMLTFKNKWVENFYRKFSDNISDFLITVTVECRHGNL